MSTALSLQWNTQKLLLNTWSRLSPTLSVHADNMTCVLCELSVSQTAIATATLYMVGVLVTGMHNRLSMDSSPTELLQHYMHHYTVFFKIILYHTIVQYSVHV